MALYEIEKSNFSAFEKRTGILGDFASLLWNGEVEYIEPGKAIVRRFGPDVPAMYLYFDELIVTQEIKNIFDEKLTGFTAIKATKKKIISADWQNFNEDFFNEYHSLYDAISKGKHSPDAANEMPKLWLIKPDFPLNFTKTSNDKWDFNYENESDFYYGSGDRLGLFISEKTKELIADLGDLLVCNKL